MMSFFNIFNFHHNSNILFLESCSPLMENIMHLHNLFLILIFSLFCFVAYCMFFILKDFTYNNYVEDKIMEMGWTVIPIFILFFFSFPSLNCLYSLEFPQFTQVGESIKIRGHQWYWSYENKSDKQESYLDTSKNAFRNLETDSYVQFSSKELIRCFLTSSDVIHSFALSGMKWDCVPGRMNLGYLFFKNPGWVFGQCSEICGANHSFMPISAFVN